MNTDLSDGVAKLVSDGIADPKRVVCIVGASYGGYAALAAAIAGENIYACAVSVAGVSDPEEMLRMIERRTGRESEAFSYWSARIGDRHTPADSARIAATAPARHADRIQMPLLLIHATGDTTVPIAQSRDMRDAMNKARRPVQYVELDGDDHYLDLADTRIRVLTEIDKFLAANIGR
jgi:dipeptidyl aminopeptidase/acylaminoacyl peptidase